MILLLILAAAGYLIGSFPEAWILTKIASGQDLRRLGSGNVGVMNVALSVSRWAGLLVFLGEAAKGLLAFALGRRLGGDEIAISLTIVATVIGIRWPIWLGGAGGRANTAGAAALLMISWPSLLMGLAAWFPARALSRSSFRATRITLLVYPFIVFIFTRSWPYTLAGVVLSVIYLQAAQLDTDDHERLKEAWPNLWSFLFSPRRK